MMLDSSSQARMRPTGLRYELRRRIPFGGAYLRGILRLRNNRLRCSRWRRQIFAEDLGDITRALTASASAGPGVESHEIIDGVVYFYGAGGVFLGAMPEGAFKRLVDARGAD